MTELSNWFWKRTDRDFPGQIEKKGDRPVFLFYNNHIDPPGPLMRRWGSHVDVRAPLSLSS